MSRIVQASRLFRYSQTLSNPVFQPITINFKLPSPTPLLVCERGAKAKATTGGAKGGKGGKGGAMQKAILDVEEDANKLVTEVCGLNYQLETDPVLIKPDSEYPDWLWTINVKRPLPPLEEMVNIDLVKTLWLIYVFRIQILRNTGCK
jgi:hypothetical protein